MRYKSKIMSNLDIIVNKMERLSINVDKGLYNNDRQKLVTDISQLTNDIELVKDLVEKEEDTFHHFKS